MNIETLSALCRKLPGVTEDIKWGNDLCFLIGGKMFCVAGLHNPLMISFKTTDTDFESLTAITGIIPAPYLARHKWVLVEEEKKLNAKQWEFYIKQSYQLVKSKLSKKQLKDAGLTPT